MGFIGLPEGSDIPHHVEQMNLELKEELFRYIFPPCIFWGLILLSSYSEKGSIEAFGGEVSTSLIIFIFSGIVISAIGSYIIYMINMRGTKWLSRKGEFRNWEKLSHEDTGDFIRNKINRRYNFFTTHLNSIVAIVCFLIFYYGPLIINPINIDSRVPAIFLCIILLPIFAFLAHDAYSRSEYFNHRLNSDKNKKK